MSRKPAKVQAHTRIVIDYAMVERLSALVVGDRELAYGLGITESLLYDRRRDDPEFRAAEWRGKALRSLDLLSTINERARMGDMTAIKMLAKRLLGWSDTSVVDVTVSGVVEHAHAHEHRLTLEQEANRFASITAILNRALNPQKLLSGGADSDEEPAPSH